MAVRRPAHKKFPAEGEGVTAKDSCDDRAFPARLVTRIDSSMDLLKRPQLSRALWKRAERCACFVSEIYECRTNISDR